MRDDETRTIDEENLRVWEAAHEDPEGSLSAAQRLQARAEAVSYPRGRAEALRTQGYAHAVMNDVETGFTKGQEALAVLDDPHVDEPDVAATVHDSLANLYFFLGMYAQSFEHSNMGIEYARKAGATRVEAYCLRNLAVIYSEQREFDRARQLYRESRHLFESIDYRIGIAWTLHGVGEIEFEEGRLEQALEYFQRVLDAVTEQEFGMLYANARNGVARTLWRLGRLDEALSWIDQAMHAPRQYARIRAETLLIHAHIRAAAGEEARALEIFHDAAGVAEQDRHPDVEVEAREERARRLAEKGDYYAAYQEQARASGVRRLIYDEDKQRELRNTELRYGLEQVRREAEERRLADLQRMNEELEERVRRRTRDLESERARLEEVNRELERISSERQDLIRILSHDLRSPFTAIWELVPFAREEPEESSYLDMMKESAERGLAIIDAVRQMLAVETGKQQLEMAPVPLREAVDEAIAAADHAFGHKDIQFTAHVDERLVVLADRATFVNSVLTNLLTNAAKFSDPGGVVTVEAAHNGDHAQIAVRDRGIGMSRDLLDSLFDPFAPTTRNGTQGEKGTGFGMPLIKRLVERYGGSIQVDSRTGGDERGTVIHMTLPGFVTE